MASSLAWPLNNCFALLKHQSVYLEMCCSQHPGKGLNRIFAVTGHFSYLFHLSSLIPLFKVKAPQDTREER